MITLITLMITLIITPGDPFTATSNLVVTCTLQDVCLASKLKPRVNHCFWFEELDSYNLGFWRLPNRKRPPASHFGVIPPALYLPEVLRNAPDLKFQLWHVQDDGMWVFRGERKTPRKNLRKTLEEPSKIPLKHLQHS